ncbi:MAG: hypothetical protein LBG80_02140 [Bacteroidales bacterium]|jgi:putative peptide zinc metalloprotease protein|nr:hypothetical protein [Bacteroidales bacterium]
MADYVIDLISVQQFEISTLDTSSSEKKYLIRYKERHFEVGKSVVQLIEILKHSSSLEEAKELLCLQRKENISIELMNSIINQCIIPIIESEKKTKPKPFIVRLEIIPANIVAIVSKIGRFLFEPLIVKILLFATIILHSFFYISINDTFVIGELDIITILGIIVLYIISSCFHELGHASACQYYGIEHGGVGFGLYLSFPVFYTDVSNIWKLPKNKRLSVNFAGIYFQSIFLIGLLTIYFINPNPIIGYFILTVNFNFLITLNPFFKFDGYWIVSDLLGVPNLRQRTQEVFVYLFKKIMRKQIIKKPFLFNMSKGKKIFMLIYSVIMNIFFVYVFSYIIPLFIYNFFITFPELAKNLITQIALGNMPSFSLIRHTFTQFLCLGFMSFTIYRVLKPLIIQLIDKTRNVF